MEEKDCLIDVTKVINRLNLIKNLISLEEEDIITEQVNKLQEFQNDNDIYEIISLLHQKSYGKVIIAIESFIKSRNQVAVFVDPEIEALRFEAKSLELKIQQLSDEKLDLEKLLYEFGVRHNQELGDLVLKILNNRKSQSRGTPQQDETTKDYDDFYNSFEATKDQKIVVLSADELKEIKNKYRKASKLCHPDIVNNNQKEAANEMFIELNAAYERNDLKRVSEILEDLQQGNIFTSIADNTDVKPTIKNELKRLHKCIQDLSNEIDKIKSSEAFLKVIAIENWDDFFASTKQQLKKQLNELENGRE
jgi:hypothetical protein